MKTSLLGKLPPCAPAELTVISPSTAVEPPSAEARNAAREIPVCSSDSASAPSTSSRSNENWSNASPPETQTGQTLEDLVTRPCGVRSTRGREHADDAP